MSPITYSGASCSSTARRCRRSSARVAGRWSRPGANAGRPSRYGRPCGLAVPARDAREPVRDIRHLDVERGGVEEVEPAPRQHALPGARGAALLARFAFMIGREAGRVPVTGHQMIVDHADRLHEGIHDGRSAELEAAALELLGDLP